MKWGAGLLEELEMITGAWYLPIEQKISDLSRAGPCRETGKPERNPGNASGRRAAAVFLQSPGNQKLFNTHCGCHTHYKHCLSHVSGCCDYKSEMKPFSSPPARDPHCQMSFLPALCIRIVPLLIGSLALFL